MRSVDELFTVERAFRDEAVAGDVRHDLISPMNRVPDPAGWQAFQRANSPPGPLVPQWWEVCEGGAACGRYEGESARVTRFRDLAGEAFAVLKEVECPEGGWVRFPRQDGHLGWLDVVYGTARCYATADLRAGFGWWNWTGAVTFEEDDRWGTDVDGASYPLHPAYERLEAGLFRSSAEALRLWFDPDLSRRVGECVQDAPVAFREPYLPGEDAITDPGPDSPPAIPDWDGRTLWYDGRPLRQFSRQATTCQAILAAFQKSGWAREIDGTAIPEIKGDAVSLRNVVYHLNQMQAGVRFWMSGWGEVCWGLPGEEPTRVYRGRGTRWGNPPARGIAGQGGRGGVSPLKSGSCDGTSRSPGL